MRQKLKHSLATITAISTTLFTTVSCSNDNSDIEDTKLIATNESSQDSEGGCDGDVNFKDLLVETSWVSNDTTDKDTFYACGVDGESWMDKYNSGIVMIKCKSGEGHRTELKEDSGDEAPLDDYKKIKFIGEFTSIPENGVTIAQIHNRHSSVKRPWIRVYIDSDRKVKIKETETSPNESSSTYSTYTGPQYTSGDSMTVEIWTGLSDQKKGKIQIQTGGSTYQKTLWPSDAWDSYSSDYYLKAGVYTEGEDKTATVKYDYFSISH